MKPTKKKVKMYRPIFESPTPGKYVLGDEISSDKSLLILPAEVCGWCEVEVELKVRSKVDANH